MRPLFHLPLNRNPKRLRRQWCDEQQPWILEWNGIVFTYESRFCLQHHNSRIRVWKHRVRIASTSLRCWNPWSSDTFSVCHQPHSNKIMREPQVARDVQKFFFTHQIELLPDI
ncbi:transposable element Tcb1 transposase [Trichonephila clavipes]|nr:transposable element Tcb1 transposase [Trichonephila clavipes]